MFSTINIIVVTLGNNIHVILAGEVELELERVLLERSDVHESLSKTENLVASLEQDKKRMLDDARRVCLF